MTIIEKLLWLAAFLILLTVILTSSLLLYRDHEKLKYSRSLQGKSALVKSSQVKVVILYFDTFYYIATCRVDLGEKASPRFQEVKFRIEELEVK